MLYISSHVVIPDHEIEIYAVQSQGAGGQHVNKVATAIWTTPFPALYKLLVGAEDVFLIPLGVRFAL